MLLEKINERLDLFPVFLDYLVEHKINFIKQHDQLWNDMEVYGILWLHTRRRPTYVARTFDDWLLMIGRSDLYQVPVLTFNWPKEKRAYRLKKEEAFNQAIEWKSLDYNEHQSPYDGSKLNKFFIPAWPPLDLWGGAI